MSPISLLGCPTHDRTAAVPAQRFRTLNDHHSLFLEIDTSFFFEKGTTGHHLDGLDCIPGGGGRGRNGEPVAHMPVGRTCPRCAEQGIEQFVLPGKHCPRCNQPC